VADPILRIAPSGPVLPFPLAPVLWLLLPHPSLMVVTKSAGEPP
jgi:hypothetical protein